MHARFSPTQAAHRDKVRQFFSPEAIALRSDPDVRPYHELALLDHLFSGWKNLEPRYGKKDVVITDTKGNVVREGKNELPGLHLGVDTPIQMDELERLDLQLAEINNAKTLGTDPTPDQFSELTPDEREYVRGLIREHIAPGTVSYIGGAGDEGRTFPNGHPQAGEQIPVSWVKGQKLSRGEKLLLDKASMVDSDTGIALHGVDIDAMHRKPAAEYPELVAEESNIKYGPTAMNQADGKREGAELEQSRRNRGIKLYNRIFELENGVPALQRGGIDSQTTSELKAHNLLLNKIDEIRATL